MEQSVRVWVEGDKVYLKTDWNPALGPFVDQMASRWDRDKKQFEFPVELSDHVRALAFAFFHTDGTMPVKHFEISISGFADQHSAEVAGRILATRSQPSRRPILGTGVIKVRGNFTWEGVHKPFHGPLLGVNDVVLLAALPASLDGHPALKMVQLPGREDALRAEGRALHTRLLAIRSELGIV